MKLLSVIPTLTKHVIQIRNWRLLWYQMLEKYMFVSHTKHTQQKINWSTSFAIDNMYYVNFRIWEQESVPWCSEIQNQRLEALGNTFNLHSNSTWCPRSVISKWIICVCSRENERVSNFHIQTISFIMRNLLSKT